MKIRALAGAALVLAHTASPDASAAGPPPRAAPIADCSPMKGGLITAVPWPQTRLGFQEIWPITRGDYLTASHFGAAGDPVTVAVIDSGVNNAASGRIVHPQLRGIDYAKGVDAVTARDDGDTRDCVGHGTAVTSIIAAQPRSGTPFVGVAPDARIVTVKQTEEKVSTTAALVRAIDDAIAAHARVANLSLTVITPTPVLEAAVRRAGHAGLILVCAAGNDGASTNLTAYPAAYAPRYPNVIAVSAVDTSDSIGDFSTKGGYVSVAAPGTDVAVASPFSGYNTQSGTSFAAPFVTGTVALMLATNPTMTARQVRNRLEATADPPAVPVPNAGYGYGIVNPYLAVTSIRDDSQAVPATPTAHATVPAQQAARPPDRHLQHLALGAGVILLGLAGLAVAAAAALRGSRSGAGRSAGG